MAEVNMPKLSDTMEEGTVLEWKKKDGDEVHKGDVLAEVESDKATFDLEAEDDGILTIKVEKGVPAKIGAPIAIIGPAGEAKPAKTDGAKAEKPKAEAAKAKAEPAKAEAEPETAEAEPEAAEAEPAAAAETETAEGAGDEAPAAEAKPAEPAEAEPAEPAGAQNRPRRSPQNRPRRHRPPRRRQRRRRLLKAMVLQAGPRSRPLPSRSASRRSWASTSPA